MKIEKMRYERSFEDMDSHCRKTFWALSLIITGSLMAICAEAKNVTVEDRYPGLATSVLKTVTLKDGLILTSGGLAFKEKEVKAAVEMRI